jgi:Copper transport outer membrane protein, MctB
VIDFRYHLISIIAVLLALAIGILAGSGFLGGPLLADLKHRLNNIALSNRGLESDVAGLRKTTQQNQSFAQATEPWLLQAALSGRAVVMLEPQGTETGAVDNIVSGVVTAGGTVRTTVNFTDKLALVDRTSLDQLALSIQSASSSARKLRAETAVEVGQRAAAAAHSSAVGPGKTSGGSQRFDDLLNQLEKDGFVTVDQAQDGPAVPPGAIFVVVAGGVEHAPFPASVFCLDLARALAAHAGTVLAAEPSDSTWNFVQSVRADAKAQSTVPTVDNAETVPGGIAAVLSLKDAMRGRVGHYGFGPGADTAIPEPSTTPT